MAQPAFAIPATNGQEKDRKIASRFLTLQVVHFVIVVIDKKVCFSRTLGGMHNGFNRQMVSISSPVVINTRALNTATKRTVLKGRAVDEQG